MCKICTLAFLKGVGQYFGQVANGTGFSTILRISMNHNHLVQKLLKARASLDLARQKIAKADCSCENLHIAIAAIDDLLIQLRQSKRSDEKISPRLASEVSGWIRFVLDWLRDE
jgi:hypothetical protein